MLQRFQQSTVDHKQYDQSDNVILFVYHSITHVLLNALLVSHTQYQWILPQCLLIKSQNDMPHSEISNLANVYSFEFFRQSSAINDVALSHHTVMPSVYKNSFAIRQVATHNRIVDGD